LHTRRPSWALARKSAQKRGTQLVAPIMEGAGYLHWGKETARQDASRVTGKQRSFDTEGGNP